MKHLLEELLHCLRIMHTKLIEIYSLFVGHNITKIIDYLSSLIGIVYIVEDYVDWLGCYLLEIELGPNMSFKLP